MATRHEHLADEQLSALVDGDRAQLGPGERQAAQAHLDDCAACRRRLEELRAVVGLLRALPEVDPPRDFRLGPRLVGGSARVERLRAWYTGARLFAGAAAAACVVLLAANLYLAALAPAPGTAVLSAPGAGSRAAPAAAPAARQAVPAAPTAPLAGAAPTSAPAAARAAPAAADQAVPGAAPTVGAPAAQPAAPAAPTSAPATATAPGPLPGTDRALLGWGGALLGALAVVALALALVLRRRLRAAQSTLVPQEEPPNVVV
jgi:Putative zinc-finger